MVAPSAEAQSIIRGRVTESGSSLPVSGARVVAGAAASDTTNASGQFRLVISSGTTLVRLRVMRIGFVPVERDVAPTPGREVVANFQLDRRPTGLDAVVVPSISPEGEVNVTWLIEFQRWVVSEGYIDKVIEGDAGTDMSFAREAGARFRLGDTAK